MNLSYVHMAQQSDLNLFQTLCYSIMSQNILFTLLTSMKIQFFCIGQKVVIRVVLSSACYDGGKKLFKKSSDKLRAHSGSWTKPRHRFLPWGGGTVTFLKDDKKMTF